MTNYYFNHQILIYLHMMTFIVKVGDELLLKKVNPRDQQKNTHISPNLPPLLATLSFQFFLLYLWCLLKRKLSSSALSSLSNRRVLFWKCISTQLFGRGSHLHLQPAMNKKTIQQCLERTYAYIVCCANLNCCKFLEGGKCLISWLCFSLLFIT